MKNWFSSDWHLGHNNIIEYDKRPFSTIEEIMIERQFEIIDHHIPKK